MSSRLRLFRSRNSIKMLGLAAFAVAFALMTSASLTMPSHAQSTGAVEGETLQQVPLTDETSRGAIRAYHELLQKYGNENAPESDAESMIQAFSLYDDFEQTVQDHGFADTHTWHATLMSFIIALHVHEEGSLAEMQAAVAQLAASDLPQETKDQLMARYAAMLPSEENIEVAARIASEPEMAAIIAEVRE